MPNTKTIAGVRVGLIGDKFIVNPTTKEMEDSDLDLVLAGTDSAILMIEVKFESFLLFFFLFFFGLGWGGVRWWVGCAMY